MPAATKLKTMNYDLFRKRVRLFDSDSAGERDLAIHQALIQCAECDPPLHFWEAAGVAFGSVDHKEEERLEQRVVRAEAEAQNQRSKAERSAEDAAQQKEINERLRVDNARLSEALEGRPVEADAEGGWPDIPSLEPENLQRSLCIAMAAEWSSNMPLGRFFLDDYSLIAAEWFHAIAVGMFLLWSTALYRCSGPKKLLTQWARWIAGWAVVVAWTSWLNDAFNVHTFAFQLMFVPDRWWGTMGLPFTGGDCGFAVIVLMFVGDWNQGFDCTRWWLQKVVDGYSLARRVIEAVRND